MTDLATALHFRDVLLPAIRVHGLPAETLFAQGVPVLGMRAGGSLISLWGPFRLAAPNADPEPVTAALPGPLFHRLVIWNYGGVLRLDWSEDGSPTLHRFVPGEWEDALLHALSTLPTNQTNEV